MPNNKENINEIAKRMTFEIADFIFTKSQENLVKMGAIDTANLLRSGRVIPEGDYWSVHYDAPYATAINFGTEPHGVNPDVLKPWIRRKLKVKQENEVNKIAFLISRKIKSRGTKPQPFMSNAIETAKSQFREKIEKTK